MLLGKRDADLGAAAGFTLEGNLAAVVHGRVLDDGQAESRAAGGLGMALIHAVEPLEDAASVLRRDAMPVSATRTLTQLSDCATWTQTLRRRGYI